MSPTDYGVSDSWRSLCIDPSIMREGWLGDAGEVLQKKLQQQAIDRIVNDVMGCTATSTAKEVDLETMKRAQGRVVEPPRLQ